MSTELPEILRGREWRHVATARFVRSDGIAIHQIKGGKWTFIVPDGLVTLRAAARAFATAGAAATFLKKNYPLQPETKNV
ncbi:hypothetical protein [Sphingomonas oryzagri]|uniref:DUF4224 domain-containing protein n=1 Tax=Sphingomonas oryzagri TaxID=3042314 RepID=A0ABT6N7R9_9SPHN|nr:hypothetical protein [Sphingomonas oryzagri]MDH7641172.1 hypothetical protein [Sphingomonas oryzagri]